MGAIAQVGLPLRIDADARLETRPLLDRFPYAFQRLSDSSLLFLTPDSASAVAAATALLNRLREQSYLEASIDSLNFVGDGAFARLHLGSPARWGSLRVAESVPKAWLRGVRYNPGRFRDRRFQYDPVLDLQKRLLNYGENRGYPFCSVWLDSVLVDTAGRLDAVLQIKTGQYFRFGRLTVKGDLRLPDAYLRRFLGIQKGMPYSREKVLRIRDQLRALPFLEAKINPSVGFAGGEAIVQVNADKKRAGRFDFIVGLLPQPDAQDGKLLLTGSLTAAFQNALSLGEKIHVEFERLKPETQKLVVQTGVPYLFGGAFGADGKLHIFRRDSSWVDAQGDIGLQYFFTGADFFRFFWDFRSSSLQKIDTLAIKLSRQLPTNLDLRQNSFGIEANFNRLDYRFNPRKGWLLSIKAQAGFNRILRNAQIESLRISGDSIFSFAALYDAVSGRSARFRLEGQMEYFWPLFARTTVKLGLQGGGIFTPDPLYTNEQYRLGGNKRLRGFNEESLFAGRFVMATTEIRLLIGPNSFMAAFMDYAYLENTTVQVRQFLRPLGLGAGMNFETKAGIFGISLAVGRPDVGQSVDFRAAKFHIGYISLF